MKKTTKKSAITIIAIIAVNLIVVAAVYLIITLLDKNRQPGGKVPTVTEGRAPSTSFYQPAWF